MAEEKTERQVAVISYTYRRKKKVCALAYLRHPIEDICDDQLY